MGNMWLKLRKRFGKVVCMYDFAMRRWDNSGYQPSWFSSAAQQQLEYSLKII